MPGLISTNHDWAHNQIFRGNHLHVYHIILKLLSIGNEMFISIWGEKTQFQSLFIFYLFLNYHNCTNYAERSALIILG